MFKVVVSDLDGTLLNSFGKISDYTKSIIKSLYKNNIKFIVATGRHYLDFVNLFNNDDVKLYSITANGSVVFDNKNNLLFYNKLNENVLLEIINFIYLDKDISTHIFSEKFWITNSKSNLNRSYVKKYEYEDLLKNKDKLNNSCKIHFNSKNIDSLLKLEINLNKNWKDYIDVNFSLPICLEVTPKGVSKGNSLKNLLKKLNLNLLDCISFGDGMNDFDMLSITKKGCIMKNASINLKNKLPNLEIIDSNENDGVAKYIKENILNKM